MRYVINLAILSLVSLGIFTSTGILLSSTELVAAQGNVAANNPAPIIDQTTPVPRNINSEITGGWQTILEENFSGSWPRSGDWRVVDLYNDTKTIYWATDQYRFHSSNSAAWPARGGRDGRDPTIKTNDYFNNMDTRMIFGQFDLSDASTANISFWMWWQTETNNDMLKFEISHDNTTFIEYGRWSGTSAGWQQICLSLDQFLGDNSVWVSWRFISNASIVYDGPWVDDIVIQKLPYVNLSGTVFYDNRNGENKYAQYTKVYLMDKDWNSSDDNICTYYGNCYVYTDEWGNFTFDSIKNQDVDEISDGFLDLYVKVETYYKDAFNDQHENLVTYLFDGPYSWDGPYQKDIDKVENYTYPKIQTDDANLGAMWIFQDLNNAWKRVYDSTFPHFDAGSVHAKWEANQNCFPLPDLTICNPFFFSDIFESFIFISDGYTMSSDTVVHETGHNYMYSATRWWWWLYTCWDHDIFKATDESCAWSEGWADFFPLFINGDTCYDRKIGPCTGTPDIDKFDLEAHGRGDGFLENDIVEGRVAGALYDIFDDTNDGFDSVSYGFNSISEIILQEHIGYDSIRRIWEIYRDRNGEKNNNDLVRTIYQNTINYDESPRFVQPLPPLQLYKNNDPVQIDLWLYADDQESNDWELTFQYNYTYGCHAQIDNNRLLTIYPAQNWIGVCEVTIDIDDGLKPPVSDTFLVSVTEPTYTFLLTLYFMIIR